MSAEGGKNFQKHVLQLGTQEYLNIPFCKENHKKQLNSLLCKAAVLVTHQEKDVVIISITLLRG